jgi:type IV secretion system protein VirD4
MCARHNPIYGEKLLYYKDKRFKERASIPPPVYSDTVRKVATFRDIEAMTRPIMQDMLSAQERVRQARAAEM